MTMAKTTLLNLGYVHVTFMGTGTSIAGFPSLPKKEYKVGGIFS
jgi:hypothetical protein